jgi:hypothetical protein
MPWRPVPLHFVSGFVSGVAQGTFSAHKVIRGDQFRGTDDTVSWRF